MADQTEATRQSDWILPPCVDTTGRFGGNVNAVALGVSITAGILDLTSLPGPPGFLDPSLAAADVCPLGHYVALQAKGVDVYVSFASSFAAFSASQVACVVMAENGSGYAGAPTVTFSGGGATTQATGVALVDSSGRVAQIVMLTPGVGYTSVPTVTIAAPSSGTTATATAKLGAPPNPGTFTTVSATTGEATMSATVPVYIPQGTTLFVKLPTGSPSRPAGAASTHRFLSYVTASGTGTLYVWQSSP